jgi:TonB family protein
MSLPLNYFIEANLALCLFLLLYVILLKNETNFTFKRLSLLSGLAASIIFPAFHITSNALSLPSVEDALATTLLPEFVVVGNGSAGDSSSNSFQGSEWVTIIYATGVVIFLGLFTIRLLKLLAVIFKWRRASNGPLRIVESEENMPPFSFFNFIFIGQAHRLTAREKDQIIAHESVHVKQLHSLDVLITNVIQIFFWFNPVVGIYKNILTQLHEFEADARSVKDEEVGDYCSLLARVALSSADLRIANHFSSSLTLKRIQMMRKVKLKIQIWKVATMILIIPAFFVLLSCQDQIAGEVSDIASNSTMALDLPADVQRQYDEMKKAHPDKQYLVVEVDQQGTPKVEALQKKMEQLPEEAISAVNVIKHPAENANEMERNFIIVEYTDQVKQMAQANPAPDAETVFTIVDETAMPQNGIESFYGFIGNELVYPKSAREKGVHGKVFVSFVVEKDGTLSEFEVLKSLTPEMDAEALRVLKLSPKWNPAQHNGQAVRQRMVMPINFMLSQTTEKAEG